MAVPRPTQLRSSPIRDLAALVGAGDPASEASVTGVTLDSRAVQPGDLYAALPGARAHGADFAGQAAAAGAVAVLTDRAGADRMAAADVALPAVVVEQPRTVLGAVCAHVLGTEHLTLRLVGITGTNGKTTTAYLVHSALSAMGRHPGLIGTVETRIGDERVGSVRTTPEAPELHAVLAVMQERGLDSCVMEVSSHALAQHRVDGVGLRRGAVHQPLPGPPRLPRRHGRLLRRQGVAVHPGAGPPGAGVHRRRLGSRGWSRAPASR